MENESVSSKYVKVLMTLASLLLATVLLASSSYAWFTVSKAPEVSKIKVTMAAAENFEIAIYDPGHPNGPPDVTDDDYGSGGSEFIYWGETVEFTDGAELEFPATADGGTIKTLKFSESKRTNGLEPATFNDDSNSAVSYYTCNVGDESLKCAAAFKVWLRTNTGGPITCAVEEVTGAEDVSVFVDFKSGPGAGASGSCKLASGQTISLSNLTASEDPTLCLITVYIDGTDLSAMDVSADATLPSIEFSLKFTNGSIETD